MVPATNTRVTALCGCGAALHSDELDAAEWETEVRRVLPEPGETIVRRRATGRLRARHDGHAFGPWTEAR